MTWLKDVYLDVVVLLVIALFALYTNSILEVIIWVYTGLLLLSKILALFMPSLQQRANKTTAPNLFYHLIYALTVGIFFYIQNYLLGVAWIVIWIVSVISLSSSKKKTT